MGWMLHDAIVVTSAFEDTIKQAHEKAIEFGLQTTNIVCTAINGYYSFLIGPDGSKEGWPDSTLYDQQRIFWINWTREHLSTYCDWVHVRFGGDYKEELTAIADCSNL
jgi:hypothetical protein